MTQMYGTVQLGVTNYLAYIIVFLNEMLAHLFDLSTGHLVWTEGAVPFGATAGEIQLGGTVPEMTPKGEDIVAALMTIIHNGIVFVAEITTLLPSNNLNN